MSLTEKLKAAHERMRSAAEAYKTAADELHRSELDVSNRKNEVERLRKSLLEAKGQVEAEERNLGLPLGGTK